MSRCLLPFPFYYFYFLSIQSAWMYLSVHRKGQLESWCCLLSHDCCCILELLLLQLGFAGATAAARTAVMTAR